MKILALTLMALSLSAAVAQADSCDNTTACGFSIDSTAVPLAATSLWSSTTSGTVDERAAYIQAVQDDAAAYLAGADESSLLQEAIAQLRNNNKASGTDLEIAAALIGE